MAHGAQTIVNSGHYHIAKEEFRDARHATYQQVRQPPRLPLAASSTSRLIFTALSFPICLPAGSLATGVLIPLLQVQPPVAATTALAPSQGALSTAFAEGGLQRESTSLCES